MSFVTDPGFAPTPRSVTGAGTEAFNGVTQIRLAPADYPDGIGNELAGENRANPRVISNIVFEQLDAVGATESRPNPLGASSLLWVWGQFLDHDFNRTSAGTDPANITPPPDDPVFTNPIGFNRAIVATGTGETTPREYPNRITGFIDGSNIYGSDSTAAQNVRVVDPITGALTAKLVLDTGGLIALDDRGRPITGDGRATENIALGAMHALFHRLHNLIVDELAAADPSLTETQLFDGARARVEAIMQAITFNEFLPILVGDDAIPEYTGFRSDVSPTMSLEFSGAIFRLGHTLLSPTIVRLDENGDVIPEGNVSLRDAFFNPALLQQGGIDPLLRGMSTTEAQDFDTFVVEDVRSFLILSPAGRANFDLAALNIQRGRDLGLSSYNDTREALGLARKTSFAEITSDPEVAARLAAAYSSVDDIDLWVGTLAEDAVGGGLVGELASVVLIDQFTRLRDGDPLWSQGRGFSTAEIDALWSVRLSDVVEAVTGVEETQDNMFMAFDRVAGTEASESLEGGDASDLLLGKEGDDLLLGLGGDDHVVGDAGDDTLDGGAGDNTLDGGDGSDLFRIDLSLGGTTTLRGFAAEDRLEFIGLESAATPTAAQSVSGAVVDFGDATILFEGLELTELPAIPGLVIDMGDPPNTVLIRVGGTGTVTTPTRFSVLIDDVSFGQFAITAPVAGVFDPSNDALFEDLVFEVDGLSPQRVDVVLLNDGFEGTVNRDLWVDYIELNGVRFETEQAAVSLFTNASGPQAVTGREAQFRNGTMRFDDLPPIEAGNAAPILDPVTDVTVREGETAIVPVRATDANGDPIALSATLVDRVTGLAVPQARWSFSGTGAGAGSLRFDTGFTDAGVYDVLVTASDGRLSAQTGFTLTVEDVTVTALHTVLARIGGTGSSEALTEFEIVVDDVSHGRFSVSNPVSESFDPANDAFFEDVVIEVAGAAPRRVDIVFFNDGFSGPINRDLWIDYIDVNGVRFEAEQSAVSLFANAAGPQTVTGREVQFRDGTMRFDDLPVTQGREAPELAALEDAAVSEGETARIAVSATDVNGDVIALSATLVDRASGLAVDPSRYEFLDRGDGTGELTFLTGPRDAGVYDVKVRADDGALFDETTVALTVVDAPNTVLMRIGGTGTTTVPPLFDVRIDGTDFGRFAVPNPVNVFDVRNDALFDDFVFTVSDGRPRSVEIEFVNDGGSGGVARDLFIDYIEVDGQRFETELFAVSRTPVAGGIQEVVGREGQFRNGVMLFDDLPVA